MDEARWWHRGRRWCHLVSDASLDELHAFADANGIPRRGFQGDHYDVPSEFRLRAIAAGARPVPSREIVHALRSIGLRARRRGEASGRAAGFDARR